MKNRDRTACGVGERFCTSHALRIVGWAVAAVMLGVPGVVPRSASAQDLISLYQQERFHQKVRQVRAAPTMHLTPRPLRHLASPADTLRDWLRLRAGEDTTSSPAPTFEVSKWRSVKRLTQGWFRKQFGDWSWTFSGNNRLTPLDTLFTPKLRARLEGRFGAPTRVLSDASAEEFEALDQYIQFEYWLVVNDSIPMKVVDINGPFERGLVVATGREYKDALGALRQALEAELLATEPAPFVDYYYLVANETWYRTGFDGERYFVKPIEPPNLHLGRPYIEKAPSGSAGGSP